MKMILDTTGAYYTEHDEIVGLAASVDDHASGSRRQIGVISTTGLTPSALPHDEREPVPSALLSESCRACAAMILERSFPQVAEGWQTSSRRPPESGTGHLAIHLVQRRRRSVMG